MAKLHEVLAVEGQLKSQATATRTDLRATFTSKRHLFEEKVQSFVPSVEGEQASTEQQSTLQTTVFQELGWIADLWGKSIDASYQVSDANTKAFADVVLDDGTKLLEHVPATALLELEKRANEIIELLKAVPTLDPAKGFVLDADRGANIYRARETRKARTKKTQKILVLYQSTKEHPAQTQLVSEDIVVGHITEQDWSGLITPAQKAKLLERAEAFGRAVKKARSRANEVEVGDVKKVGKVIFEYVFRNI